MAWLLSTRGLCYDLLRMLPRPEVCKLVFSPRKFLSLGYAFWGWDIGTRFPQWVKFGVTTGASNSAPRRTLQRSNSNFHMSACCSTLHNSPEMGATRVSINRQMDEQDVVMGHWSIQWHKGMDYCTDTPWINQDDILTSEKNQKQKTTQPMILLMWKTERRLAVAKDWGSGRQREWPHQGCGASFGVIKGPGSHGWTT